MRQPSLYSHFASKNAIYDGMFEQAWPTFLDAGENGPAMALDAIDFCRAVARRPATIALGELMNTGVPF
jgi:AcrR family transcriptional regulator